MKLNDEQRALIKTLSEGGFSPSEIASLMEIPITQVRYWLNPLRSGRPDKAATEKRAQEMARLYRTGVQMAAIGKKYNLSRERVRQILKKEMGITGATDPIPPARKCKAPKFKPTSIDKYWARVDKTPGYGPNGDCWKWTGGHYGNTSNPSGRAFFRGKSMPARRVAYLLAHRKWPDREMKLGSTCDIGDCVNPDHIIVGTIAEIAFSRSPIYRRNMRIRKERNGQFVDRVPEDQGA